jgi:hypothetical protein
VTAAPFWWADVVRRLAPARHYWLGTATPSGAPHAAPVWGAVVDEQLHFYSERSTVKAANLVRDPRAVVHLEDPVDVLIVHGTLEDLGPPSDHPTVVDALDRKYTAPRDRAYLPSAEPAFDVLWRLRPARALAWSLDDWDGSQRRWTAGE